MKFLRHLSLASLLLLVPALAGERPVLEKPVSIRRIDGELVIDAKGVPISFTPAKDVPGSLGARIPTMVAALRFEPVVEGGAPRVARMPARLTLVAEVLENGNYKVALENLTFPEHCGCRSQRVRFVTEQRPGLRFPESRIGLDADVLVALRFGLDGRVEDAAV